MAEIIGTLIAYALILWFVLWLTKKMLKTTWPVLVLIGGALTVLAAFFHVRRPTRERKH